LEGRQLRFAYCPIGSSESIESPFGVLEFIVWEHDFVDFHDGVPELLMVLLQDDDRAGCLGVEGAGDMLDGVVDELFDTGVGNGGLVGELVVCTTLLYKIGESL